MSYIINTTSGNVLVTLQDGTTNTDTGLILIGRNYTGYGEAQNENFVRLLENFADTLPPGESVGINPIAGQLWWDSGNQYLKIFNGENFIPVSQQTNSATAPTSKAIGDQWWDSTNKQLNVWTGSVWQLIGPAYTASQLKSGPVVETITDTNTNSHTVVNTYTNGNLISITSFDSTFTPASSITGINTVKPGINLLSNVTVNGTATNSEAIGNVTAASLARIDVNTTFNYDVAVAGKLVLTNANIYFANKTLILQNKNLSGNIELYVNTPLGNVQALAIDASTGLSYVSDDPINPLGISTKGYVDTLTSAISNNLTNSVNDINANITTLRIDTSTYITSNVVSIYNSLALTQNTLTANINTLTNATNANTNATNAWLSTLDANVGVIVSTTLPTLAPIASPTFTGTPRSVTVLAGDNSTKIATTAFVATSNVALQTDYNTKITNLALSAQANLVNATTGLANIASPTFTGIPTAPTPVTGDNSTNIATTAFVTGEIAAQKFNYTVSSNPPSGGNNGDFWFQIG